MLETARVSVDSSATISIQKPRRSPPSGMPSTQKWHLTDELKSQRAWAMQFILATALLDVFATVGLINWRALKHCWEEYKAVVANACSD